VIVNPNGLLLPADVRTYAQSLLKKRRDSPELRAEELVEFAEIMERLEVMIEATLQSEILSDTALFPKRSQYKRDKYTTGTREFLVERLEHHQFPPHSVPCNRRAERPLVAPKPDILYGYAPGAFRILPASRGPRLLEVIERPELKSADPTNHKCFWPFFATEFKSQRGSMVEAENQNAGSGASNVKSFQTLMTLAYPEEVPSLQESLVFSCTLDAMQARISVHWRDLLEGDEAPFMSAEIELYNMRNPEHVQALRTCLSNILDWALEERLPVIQKALMTYDALKNNIPIMEHELFSKMMGGEANVELVPSAASGVVHDENGGVAEEVVDQVSTVPVETGGLAAATFEETGGDAGVEGSSENVSYRLGQGDDDAA